MFRFISRVITVFWRWITGKTKRARLQAGRKRQELADVFNRALSSNSVVEVIIGKNKLRVPGRIVKKNNKSIWIELPNGDVLKRKLPRHLISGGVVDQVARGSRKLSYNELVAYGKGEL